MRLFATKWWCGKWHGILHHGKWHGTYVAWGGQCSFKGTHISFPHGVVYSQQRNMPFTCLPLTFGNLHSWEQISVIMDVVGWDIQLSSWPWYDNCLKTSTMFFRMDVSHESPSDVDSPSTIATSMHMHVNDKYQIHT